MSEHLTHQAEHQPLLPTAEHPEVMLPTAEQAEPLRPGETIRNVEQARTTVEQSLPAERAHKPGNPLEALKAEEAAATPAAPQTVNPELKRLTLQRKLTEIRRTLPAPQRAFSRLIHQPVVRVVSQAAGQTVSRPSGLLGGGLVAFIGTSGYLYLARTAGFRYNYLVFLLLLAGGFILGVVLEAVIYLLRHSARRR